MIITSVVHKRGTIISHAQTNEMMTKTFVSYFWTTLYNIVTCRKSCCA